MSFLAPLYLLAGLAVSLPVLFHLIRRTPRGRQVFSSVMFLSPSPPRVTRRSRLEHWLLLLLRATAICLIAAAFARPFLRDQEHGPALAGDGRRIALLLDTSASMRRPGYWDAARERLGDVLEDLRADDAVALFTFDRDVRPLVTLDEWRQMDPPARIPTLLERAARGGPSWFSTQLGTAMIEAAEYLEDDSSGAGHERLLLVISDLQAGSDWEPLNGYPWPDGVRVQLERVGARTGAANATLHVVADETSAEDLLRIRVSNSRGADRESYRIGWEEDFSPLTGEAGGESSGISVYVPPGQSRVLRAPERPERGEPQRLVLTGDDEDFDNVCYVASRPPWNVNLLYMEDDADPGTSGLRFFLEPLFPSTPARNVQIHDWEPGDPAPPLGGRQITLLIVGGNLDAPQTEWVRNWTRQGGQVLYVARGPEQAAALYDLLSIPPARVLEAEEGSYAMLQRVDLSHPVLAQFDDPRYSDFTRLRFWKHRVFDPDSIPEMRSLATYDDGAPAFAEIPLQKGRIFLLTSGWGRRESELAVWSKFVPLMNRLLEYAADRRTFRPQFHVGDELRPDDLGFESERIVLKTPTGELLELAGDRRHLLDRPGIYRLAESREQLEGDSAARFAVNLHPRESETDLLAVELLEAAGVRLQASGTSEPTVPDEDQRRQLMNRELESKQQIWRWLILSALGVLLAETLLAGWLGRNSGSGAEV